jgi:hypothetical protein
MLAVLAQMAGRRPKRLLSTIHQEKRLGTAGTRVWLKHQITFV